MHRSAVATAVLFLTLASSAAFAVEPCARHDGSAFRDVHWQHGQQKHPLIGQVLKGEQPIAVASGGCARSALQQLIFEVWDTIRGGGVVLLGEVHDNPEHHAVRGDILWPRLDHVLPTRDLRPAAVFEHIRTSQQTQLDAFYRKATRSRRLWGAPDLLRELSWAESGWPAADTFYPLFNAALRARMPIIPGNAVRERMRELVKDTSVANTDEADRLRLAQAMPQPLLEALATELEGSHCGAIPASAFGAMSLAQRYTDAHLAQAVVSAADKNSGAFLLAGNGHVRTDRAVPWYVRQMAPGRKVVSVMLLEAVEGRADATAYLPRSPDQQVAADYILFTPQHPREDPCTRMRKGNR